MNEAVPKLHSDETPAFDDIYVPGIGVRGALSDDGGESSDFRSGVGQRFAGGAASVNRWAVRTFGNVRRVGVRVAVRLKRTGSEAQIAITHQRKLLSQLTNAGDRHFRRTRRRLFDAVPRAGSGLRGAIKKTVVYTGPLSATIIRVLQKMRSRSLRIAHISSGQIHGTNKYRLSLLPISAAAGRSLRRTRSFLFRMAGSSNRFLAAANYKALLRVPSSYKPDLPTLRRAAAPLTILLVMMVFLIQEIVMVIKR
jgi:hypothetical protein